MMNASISFTALTLIAASYSRNGESMQLYQSRSRVASHTYNGHEVLMLSCGSHSLSRNRQHMERSETSGRPRPRRSSGNVFTSWAWSVGRNARTSSGFRSGPP
jgi:hypothetical protein